MSAGLVASVDRLEVAPTESGGRIEVKMVISVEVDDARALEVVLKLVEALVAARGEGRP